MPLFRVHIQPLVGATETVDVAADHPDESRAAANNRRPGRITKVKILKDEAELALSEAERVPGFRVHGGLL